MLERRWVFVDSFRAFTPQWKNALILSYARSVSLGKEECQETRTSGTAFLEQPAHETIPITIQDFASERQRESFRKVLRYGSGSGSYACNWYAYQPFRWDLMKNGIFLRSAPRIYARVIAGNILDMASFSGPKTEYPLPFSKPFFYSAVCIATCNRFLFNLSGRGSFSQPHGALSIVKLTCCLAQ